MKQHLFGARVTEENYRKLKRIHRVSTRMETKKYFRKPRNIQRTYNSTLETEKKIVPLI